MTDRDAMAFGFELGREWIDNGFQNPRSHWRSDLVPLLELQEWQHRATFTSIIGLSFHSVVIEVLPRCIASSIAVGRTLCY